MKTGGSLPSPSCSQSRASGDFEASARSLSIHYSTHRNLALTHAKTACDKVFSDFLTAKSNAQFSACVFLDLFALFETAESSSSLSTSSTSVSPGSFPASRLPLLSLLHSSKVPCLVLGIPWQICQCLPLWGNRH